MLEVVDQVKHNGKPISYDTADSAISRPAISRLQSRRPDTIESGCENWEMESRALDTEIFLGDEELEISAGPRDQQR